MSVKQADTENEALCSETVIVEISGALQTLMPYIVSLHDESVVDIGNYRVVCKVCGNYRMLCKRSTPYRQPL